MKQTAIEWLESNLPTAFKDLTINKQLIEQAKEMEKQKKDEFAIGFAEWCIWNEVDKSSTYSYKKLLEIYKKEKEL